MSYKGYKFSEESKKKMSESAKKRGINPDLKKRVSLALKGKKRDPEIGKKISESKKGYKFSEESKMKMSEAQSGYKSYRWKGGRKGYCIVMGHNWWRKTIRNRDNNTCQLCGITKQLSYKLFSRDLCIHHINHNGEDCNFNNVSLLCNRCNQVAESKYNIDFMEYTLMSKRGTI